MFRFIQLALLFAAATAFTASKPLIRQPTVSTTARFIIMTDEETNAILAKAEDCMGEECSIDEVDELLTVLKDTQGELEGRLGTIVGMIGKLQHLNEKDEREVDEVREFVRDMLRVFNTDKPGFAPIGFSGDIGDGPKTAYDALPPKPWKADK